MLVNVKLWKHKAVRILLDDSFCLMSKLLAQIKNMLKVNNFLQQKCHNNNGHFGFMRTGKWEGLETHGAYLRHGIKKEREQMLVRLPPLVL